MRAISITPPLGIGEMIFITFSERITAMEMATVEDMLVRWRTAATILHRTDFAVTLQASLTGKTFII